MCGWVDTLGVPSRNQFLSGARRREKQSLPYLPVVLSRGKQSLPYLPVVERSELCSCWLGLRRSVDSWRFWWRTGVSWAEDSSRIVSNCEKGRIVSNCEKGTNNSQLIKHQVLHFWQTHLVLSKRKTETNWIWKTLEDLRSVFTLQRWELLLTL